MFDQPFNVSANARAPGKDSNNNQFQITLFPPRPKHPRRLMLEPKEFAIHHSQPYHHSYPPPFFSRPTLDTNIVVYKVPVGKVRLVLQPVSERLGPWSKQQQGNTTTFCRGSIHHNNPHTTALEITALDTNITHRLIPSPSPTFVTNGIAPGIKLLETRHVFQRFG
jgi:hypothetical protein